MNGALFLLIAMTVAPWPWVHSLKYGNDCNADTDTCEGGLCKEGKCACGGKTPFRNSVTMECEGYGFDTQCIGDDCYIGLACIGGVCRCPDEQKYRTEDKRCVRMSSVTINGPCLEDSGDCISNANLVCIDKVCACDAKEEWIEGKCQLATVQTKCNPDDEPDKCTELTSKNFVCDETKKVCRCAEGMEFSAAAHACKLTFGQECRVNDTSIHDLCLSQHCGDDTDQSEDFGKCSCADVNGRRQIWSSELRCVEERYGMSCDGKNEGDCAHGGQNAARVGLSCQEERCACAKPLTYIQAYCIDASRNHDQDCDERRITSACRMGTSLSCLDVDGSGFKCVCLPRKIVLRRATNQKAVFTPLVWSSANGRCELKPLDYLCASGYECQSGECSKGGLCVERKKGQGGGGKVAAQFQIALLITAAILF